MASNVRGAFFQFNRRSESIGIYYDHSSRLIGKWKTNQFSFWFRHFLLMSDPIPVDYFLSAMITHWEIIVRLRLTRVFTVYLPNYQKNWTRRNEEISRKNNVFFIPPPLLARVTAARNAVRSANHSENEIKKIGGMAKELHHQKKWLIHSAASQMLENNWLMQINMKLFTYLARSFVRPTKL